VSVLDQIVQAKKREVATILPALPELRARAHDAPPPRGFAQALRSPAEVTLLAEIKRRSPSAGPIRPGSKPLEVARSYEEGGAAALSVLTDAEYFGGELAALATVRGGVALPVLRKDFIIDPVQLWEARAAGADAVLLIVRILDDARLRKLLELAVETGMDALIEVHDEREIERALAAGGSLIGINNRDLDTFRTDVSRSIALAPSVPADLTLVAESGIRSADDVRRLGAAGVDAVLVGESLMRQEDLRAAAAALVGQLADRRARP
jgi:indole-3-glycerol phosphate synthase